MSPAAEGGAAAQRRREASLERLKRRSATSRWDELRRIWQPSPEEETQPTVEDAEDGSVQPVRQESVDPSQDASSPGLLVPSVTDGAGVQEALPRLPALPPNHAIRPVPSQPQEQPVWHLSQDSGGQRLDSEREQKQQMAAIGDVLPKPITSILPYYDYAPGGEDACEYLCPRPEGCKDDEDAPPCPELVELPDVSLAGRNFVDTHVLWEPSNLFHNPLYFEDHALERYGHTHHQLLQPLVSVGKFGVQFVGLPYQMALHPVHECQYALGWHRPGECVPYRYHLPPWNTKAALVAAGTYTGLIFLFP
ncbi:MAG: hypothetical protein R3B91_06070 [Planctomycetaceae bacterium]